MGPLGKVAGVIRIVATGGTEGLTVAIAAMERNTRMSMGFDGEPTTRALNSCRFDHRLTAGARWHNTIFSKGKEFGVIGRGSQLFPSPRINNSGIGWLPYTAAVTLSLSRYTRCPTMNSLPARKLPAAPIATAPKTASGATRATLFFGASLVNP